ncbi:MAG: ATP-dependent helicase [Thermodesulfovibrionales bacterium]|nr:ATP-dependent helicase [Thermodesulfovibrionales bacterium]
MENIKNLLNKAQFEAVNTLHGPILVIAGAGTGKTRVIEYRCLNLIRNGINPSSILLLTFTRRAAREMIHRACRHDKNCQNIDGGTFHSFAYKMIRRYSRFIGFNQDITILDESDTQDAIMRCANSMGLYTQEKRFPKKDTLRTIISISINKNIPISETIKREYPHFIAYSDEINALAKNYVQYKIQRGYIDYDDMLIYLKIMLENDELRDKISDKYSHIMVDEYQDTNYLQGKIATYLALKHRNIMIVGDDAQSIYGFRGATHKNIMEFPDVFKDCRIIRLEKNYRSTQPILNCANAILETMENKYEKCLRSAKVDSDGCKPTLYYFKNSYDEAEWIAQQINKSLQDGTPLFKQCILCRSMYLTIPIQTELTKMGIPYETYGGIKFYEMAHVKDLLAHFRILTNPKDEISWQRALHLIEGIGIKTTERLTDEIIKIGSFANIIDYLNNYASKTKISKGIKEFIKTLESVSRLKTPAVSNIYDIVFEYYKPIMKDKFDDWHIRINDIETLRQIAGRYSSLEDMLNDFALEPIEKGVWSQEPETKEEERPLCISTIHSAKGLEWDIVYIVGLIDGVLPISFSLDSQEDIEEEKRLFYVAVTRAKKRLFLTLHHEGRKNGIYQINKTSRFITHQKVRDTIDVLNTSSHSERFKEDYIVNTKGMDDILKRVLDYYK